MKNHKNSVPNRPQVDPRCMIMCPWAVLGRRSHPGRVQDAQGSSGYSAFGCFLVEIVGPMADFGVPLGSKIAPKSHVEIHPEWKAISNGPTQ